MTIGGAGDWTFNGDIQGHGALTTLVGQEGKLTMNGTGTVTLNGDNNFVGGVEIANSGTVVGDIGNNASLTFTANGTLRR